MIDARQLMVRKNVEEEVIAWIGRAKKMDNKSYEFVMTQMMNWHVWRETKAKDNDYSNKTGEFGTAWEADSKKNMTAL